MYLMQILDKAVAAEVELRRQSPCGNFLCKNVAQVWLITEVQDLILEREAYGEATT